MFSKTLVIILIASVGGVGAISVAMMSASGWTTPGVYSGTSDASHAPASLTNCYSFQTGCMNTNSPTPAVDLNSGAYLDGNYH